MSRVLILVVLISAAAATLATMLTEGSLGRKLHADAPFYSDLAYSLAGGHGYRLHRSEWPETQHLGRLPGWPALLVPAALVTPQPYEAYAVRLTAIAVHSIDAGLIALLAYRLSGSLVAALIGGLLFGTYPNELARVSVGDSEPAFVLVSCTGLVLTVGRRYLGAFISGLAVLVRSNYVLLPLALLACAGRSGRSRWTRIAAMSAMFFLPASIWMLRNFAVSGSFVLNALDGETLYGANNRAVATNLDSWGAWIPPNQIPGQPLLSSMARSMTEVQVNAAYRSSAIRFAIENWRLYPRLITGKLLRGFLPIPWEDLSLLSFAVCAWRLLIYGAAIWLWFRRPPEQPYRAYLLASLALAVFTSVVFYGCMRFSLCFDAYLMPWLAACLVTRRGKPELAATA